MTESERYKIYLKTHPWMQSHRAARARCNDKNNNRYYCYGEIGIKFYLKPEETKKLWFRDKAYLMKKPSIDRKEKTKNYTFKNCRFIELTINVSRNFQKPILQFDLEGNFIKAYKSQTEASKILNIDFRYISAVCLNNISSINGFVFKFKD